MEVAGKIKWLDETKTYGGNGFRKREVVVTTEEQYPQHILVEFVQSPVFLGIVVFRVVVVVCATGC